MLVMVLMLKKECNILMPLCNFKQMINFECFVMGSECSSVAGLFLEELHFPKFENVAKLPDWAATQSGAKFETFTMVVVEMHASPIDRFEGEIQHCNFARN